MVSSLPSVFGALSKAIGDTFSGAIQGEQGAEQIRSRLADEALRRAGFGLERQRFGLEQGRYGMEQGRYGMEQQRLADALQTSQLTRRVTEDALAESPLRRAMLGRQYEHLGTQLEQARRPWQVRIEPIGGGYARVTKPDGSFEIVSDVTPDMIREKEAAERELNWTDPQAVMRYAQRFPWSATHIKGWPEALMRSDVAERSLNERVRYHDDLTRSRDENRDTREQMARMQDETKRLALAARGATRDSDLQFRKLTDELRGLRSIYSYFQRPPMGQAVPLDAQGRPWTQQRVAAEIARVEQERDRVVAGEAPAASRGTTWAERKRYLGLGD